ncbi:hypothetical protein [Pajaroellobacter abortibovis]|uniref:Uncharacterized protein n=1 Tax=Pajaroellobacter abortibovis TaxID=1882918 RepID=A0A1L6MYR4_9BACT|nr:hypothetical protein [Pajaroellobacter abortibovis]APS00670.1 hypothetical protein BCY86_08275 [Pajaroellobacter abortibovis]
MIKQGASLYVEGKATKPEEIDKTFHWHFNTKTRYYGCKTNVGGQKVAGLTVQEGEASKV